MAPTHRYVFTVNCGDGQYSQAFEGSGTEEARAWAWLATTFALRDVKRITLAIETL